MTRRLQLMVAVLAVFALFVAACGGDDDEASDRNDSTNATNGEGDASGEELETVRFGVVGTAMQITFSPYTSVPMELGYYAEEGIELEIQNMAGSAEVVQAIVTGQLDVGVILSPPLYSAVAEGADVQSFFNLITDNFAIPHVPVDSEIESVLDMEGTTIGVVSQGAGAIPLIRSMVASEGGDPDSIDFIPVGAGADVAVSVQQGQIDVVGLWDSVFANLHSVGIELRPISDPFFDDLGFQGVVLASRDAIEQDPELLAGVGRAIAKANVFAAANPEAAVLAHWAAFPETKPTGVSEDEAIENALRGLEARLESSGPVDGRWGYATAEKIAEFGEVLVEGGLLSEAPKPSDLYTDALIEEINDFDPGPIQAEAGEYTG